MLSLLSKMFIIKQKVTPACSKSSPPSPPKPSPKSQEIKPELESLHEAHDEYHGGPTFTGSMRPSTAKERLEAKKRRADRAARAARKERGYGGPSRR